MKEQLRQQLAQNIKRARKRAKLSISKAAAALTAAGFPCTTAVLLTYEKQRPPNRASAPGYALGIFAKVYRCDVDEFFAERVAAVVAP